MPVTQEEVQHHVNELFGAVAYRNAKRVEWAGSDPAEDPEYDKKLRNFLFHNERVKELIRGICGLVQSVDLPPMNVGGPVIPGNGE